MRINRTKKVSAYTTPQQHQMVIEQASKQGVSVSDYLLDKLLKPMHQIKAIEKIQRQLKSLSKDDKDLIDLVRELIYFRTDIRHSPKTIKDLEVLKVHLKVYYKHLLNKN